MDAESSYCKRKQRSELEETTEIRTSLPEDVIIEILIRMPVKSLLNFKRVSKRWYNLIESPKFIRSHYDNPNNHPRLLTRFLKRFLHDENFHHSVTIYPDQTLIDSPVVYDDITQIHLVSSISIECMIGPVDGLFVLHLSFDNEHCRLALWNPATMEFMYITKSKLKNLDYLVGFGFDMSNMKYKVVWRNFTGSGSTKLFTFDSESESCVSVIQNKDSFDKVVENSNRLYLNGMFYWLVKGKQNQAFLVSFDMSTDEFKMIQCPPVLSWSVIMLTEMNGSVMLTEFKHGHEWCQYYSSWVLNGASWLTKNHRICFKINFPCGHPLGFWNNIKELLYQSYGDELILYDLHNEGVKNQHLGIRGDYRYMNIYTKAYNWKDMEAYKYKESLFSFSHGKKEKLCKEELLSIFKNLSIVDGDNDDVEVQNRADKRSKY